MPVKRISKLKKILLLSLGLGVGILSYFTSLSYFQKDLTPWQLEQKIDFDKQTGSTKFKTHIDALSVGGFAFCISTIIATIIVKKTNK